ncbi:MAG: hypothetical protein HXY40_14770 [Chloroflexi bacterium]|nr:hypothetical protein [Chloroflexota bacterium]
MIGSGDYLKISETPWDNYERVEVAAVQRVSLWTGFEDDLTRCAGLSKTAKNRVRRALQQATSDYEHKLREVSSVRFDLFKRKARQKALINWLSEVLKQGQQLAAASEKLPKVAVDEFIARLQRVRQI